METVGEIVNCLSSHSASILQEEPLQGEESKSDDEDSLGVHSGICSRCKLEAVFDCIECQTSFCEICSGRVHQDGKWTTHSITRAIVPEKDLNDSQMRDNVIEEILQTEKDYVQDLEILLDLYVNPLRSGKFQEIMQNPKGSLKVNLRS